MFDDDEQKNRKSRDDRGDRGERENRDDGDGDKRGGAGGGNGGFKPRLLFFLIVIGILLAIFAGSSQSLMTRDEQLADWTEFRTKVEAGKVKRVKINGKEITGDYIQGTETMATFRVVGPDRIPEEDWKWLNEASRAKNVKIEFMQTSIWPGVVAALIPYLILFLVLYFFVFRQLRGPGGPGGVLSFGRSKATLITKDKAKKTFKDVAGIDEAKYEVEELVGFLKNPKKYQRLGGRIPRGVLLIGPPGTGKTLLAKAIAGEADVPFYSISGSDFVEMFVGVGASRVRDLFAQARENSPCIIFLDEIDAVGRRRGTGLGGGHDEREQTLNEILVQMDGMESDDKIIVMASTNRPDVLDPALLRPGRFDRHVYVDLPDIKGREQILKVHSRKVKLSAAVDLTMLARATPMFSGADLENIINEAALIAVTKDKEAIENDDLEEARDKVVWGREKKSRVMDESDRWITAYHEAGHALLGLILPDTDKPHKITIIPRGPSLGATHFLPTKDVFNRTKKELKANIMVAFGGRIAEEMITGDYSTGAKADIEQATNIARRMVCEWGMSEKLGPVRYQAEEDTVFLGREITRSHGSSPGTAELIDKEVRGLIDEGYTAALKLLESRREDIELIATTLMEYEAISGEELVTLLKERKLEARKPSKQITTPKTITSKNVSGDAKPGVPDRHNDLPGGALPLPA